MIQVGILDGEQLMENVTRLALDSQNPMSSNTTLGCSTIQGGTPELMDSWTFTVFVFSQ